MQTEHEASELVARDRAPAGVGHLLELVAPGIVHGLGNSLFAVRGAAHVLRNAGASVAGAADLLGDAAEQGVATLAVVRWLVEPDGNERERAVDVLERLAGILKVPLRDRGLTARVADVEQPARAIHVDASALARATAEVVHSVARAVPRGLGGELAIELASFADEALRIAVRVAVGSDRLPFPVDVASTSASLGARLRSFGVEPEPPESDAISFRIRAVR